MNNKFWKKSFPLASLILAGGLTIASCTTGTTDTATTPTGTSIVRQVADTTSTSKGTTSQTISDTAKAAEEFLSTLSDEQKEQVLYDYNDETKSILLVQLSRHLRGTLRDKTWRPGRNPTSGGAESTQGTAE